MDRAYEDDTTRTLAVEQGFVPVVSPIKNRKESWVYDKELYKRRDEDVACHAKYKKMKKKFTYSKKY